MFQRISKVTVLAMFMSLFVSTQSYRDNRELSPPIEEREQFIWNQNFHQDSSDVVLREDTLETENQIPTDPSLQCPPAPIPENGFLQEESIQTVGSVVHIRCRDGQWLSGPAILVCVEGDGEPRWEPDVNRRCIEGQTFFEEDIDRTLLESLENSNSDDVYSDLQLPDTPPFVRNIRRPSSEERREGFEDREKGTDDQRLKDECMSRLPARCHARPEVGHCRGFFLRYYFDKVKMECNKFYYGGCGGNENNFESIDDCMAVCPGLNVLGDSIIYPK